LAHLIRNSVDHGVESPDVREKKGKNREGHVH
jgi:two-component system chemotaxis sensor kinase CheA